MAENKPSTEVQAKGHVRSFPAPGLRQIFRHITGHHDRGQSVFLSSDQGDHHRIMGEEQAVTNILYELNDDVDIEKAHAKEPPLHCRTDSIVRMVDFGPGVESPLHRAVSIDNGIVIEGVFELILDLGEKRIMRQADNITGNNTLPGRMMWILLDVHDVVANGQKREGFLGELAKEYEVQGVS
ncbi:hypothetical protein F4802DRAFT_605755 [Xylaria palmicola]|nr:hypothetical protein F4802DRAFT_605755 [Xylaria palmicola]